MLKIANLKLQYTAATDAIKNLNFELHNNEIGAFVSDSEGGKTSLVRAIAGLYDIKDGKILLNDVDITNFDIKNRDVFVMHEDGGFFPKKTLFYNLCYSLKVRKYTKDEVLKTVYTLAEEYDLTPFLYERCGNLPGDTIIRFMFARMKMREAKIYLLDDPFKLAPPHLRHQLFAKYSNEIMKIKGHVVFCTTNIDEAKTVASKIGILCFGILHQFDTIANIENNPLSLTAYKFASGYACNFTAGGIFKSETEDDYSLNFLDFELPILSCPAIKIYADTEVTVAFTLENSNFGLQMTEKRIVYYNNTPYTYGFVGDKEVKICGININLVSIKNVKVFDIKNEMMIYSI